MWMILQADEPDDYVVATGEAHTVEEFVAAAFEHVGLDWREHVRFDEEFARGASDAPALVGDPSKIRERLGWEPEVGFARPREDARGRRPGRPEGPNRSGRSLGWRRWRVAER